MCIDKDSDSYKSVNYLTVPSDDELYELVYDEIAEFTANHKSFTAFDITSSLRLKNPQYNVHHWKVRDIVHSNFEEGDFDENYERTLDSSGSYSPPPWIYHPVASTPDGEPSATPTPLTPIPTVVDVVLSKIKNWFSPV